MPFSDPITAGDILIRDAIQSPNYVAGSAGWSINKDGTAEFSDITIRGLIKSASTGVQIIDDSIFLLDPNGIPPYDPMNPVLEMGAASLYGIPVGLLIQTDQMISFSQNTGLINTPIWFQNGNGYYLPWGEVPDGFAEITAAPAGSTSAVMAAIAALTVTVDVVLDRVYEILFRLRGVQSTVAGDDVKVGIMRGAATIRDSIIRVPTTGTGWFGADITARYVATASGSQTFAAALARAAGTGTVTVSAGASSPAQIQVRDVGGV